MEYKRFNDKIVLRVDKDEEILSSLSKLCAHENIKLGLVSGIGAVKETQIGVFDVETQKYFSKTVYGLFEVSNLTGNISQMNGETYLHLHITIGNVEKNEVYAGHLNSAVVGATAEIIVSVIDGDVSRRKDESVGLNLIEF